MQLVGQGGDPPVDGGEVRAIHVSHHVEDRGRARLGRSDAGHAVERDGEIAPREPTGPERGEHLLAAERGGDVGLRHTAPLGHHVDLAGQQAPSVRVGDELHGRPQRPPLGRLLQHGDGDGDTGTAEERAARVDQCVADQELAGASGGADLEPEDFRNTKYSGTLAGGEVRVAAELPNQNDTLERIERRLRTLLPPRWLMDAEPGHESVSDRCWTLHAPGGEAVSFAVKVGRKAPGRQLEAMLAQLADVGGRPLVAAPFLSPTVRQAIAGRGVSYADATGNLHLVADRPGLFVEQRGATKDPWPTDDTLQSLRGHAAGRALRALVDFRPPYGVRDLSKRAVVPLGSLSRTLDLLDREGLVTRGERGDVGALDWERTIRRWSEDYDFGRSNRVTAYLHRGGTAAMVEKVGSRRSSRFRAHWRGGRAAPHWRPWRVTGDGAPGGLRGGCRPGGRTTRTGAGRKTPAENEATIVLAEAYDRVVFERTLVRTWDSRRRFRTARRRSARWGKQPTHAQAEGVLAWMRAHDPGWRHARSEPSLVQAPR